MATVWQSTVSFFRLAWQTQPVLVVSCAMGVIGEKRYFECLPLVTAFVIFIFQGPLFVVFGPGTKKSEEERKNWPTHYRRKVIILL